MTLDELAKHASIEPDLYSILDRVHQASGKEIDIIVKKEMDVAGSTKIARRRMPKHLVFIKENHFDTINHIIAHECGHILRMLAVPDGQRVVPQSNDWHMGNAIEKLEKEAGILPIDKRFNLLRRWITGLIMQLTNLPIDLRIETWIFKDYPKLRKEQMEWLKKDEVNIVGAMDKEIENNTIPTGYLASNAMTYAYLKGLKTATQQKYNADLQVYRRRTDIVRLGEKLYSVTRKNDGDRQSIDQWSTLIGVNNWFSWADFEDMPESYYL